MPGLATTVEYWDGRKDSDEAMFRTQRDLKALSDTFGPECLGVVLDEITQPVQPEGADV